MGGVAGHAGVFTTDDDLTRSPREKRKKKGRKSPPGVAALAGLGWGFEKKSRPSPYVTPFSPSYLSFSIP